MRESQKCKLARKPRGWSALNRIRALFNLDLLLNSIGTAMMKLAPVQRFFDRHQRMPIAAQAAIYSAIRHYLRAIEAAGTDETKAVMAQMREIPVNDFFAKNGSFAKTDGSCMTCTSCR